MKKVALIAALALSALTASATDIGVNVSQQPNMEKNVAGISTAGVTLNQKFLGYGLQAGLDRSVVRTDAVTRYSLLGTYDFAKVQKATFTAKVGIAAIDPDHASSGWAGLVGVGVSYPIAKKVALTADYTYQYSTDAAKVYNGNMVGVGVKYSF